MTILRHALYVEFLSRDSRRMQFKQYRVYQKSEPFQIQISRLIRAVKLIQMFVANLNLKGSLHPVDN